MVKMIQLHAENAQWANKILPSIIKLTDALVLSTFIDFKATFTYKFSLFVHRKAEKEP